MFTKRFTTSGPLYAIIILVAVTILVFVSERTKVTHNQTDSGSTIVSPGTSTQSTVTPAQINAPEKVTAAMPIMGNADTASANTPKPGAPVLTELVTGLEAKIAADPENVGYKILLAQTYNEIGKRAEGIALLRELHDVNPDTSRVTLVLVSILAGGEKQKEINEALELLNEIDDIDRTRAGAVPLYKGIAYIKLGRQEQALRTWHIALQEIAKDDRYRPQIEQQIAQFQ